MKANFSKFTYALLALLLFGALSFSAVAANSIKQTTAESTQVSYHRTTIDGVEIFYRAAGPQDAPAIVLLHGFPTSSQMYRELIPRLADKYRVIAPDFPGFGQSAAPSPEQYKYSFEGAANLVDKLLVSLKVDRYALYLMDYGAPVGFQLAVKHPERVSALLVQNGNAYLEGIGAFWDPIKKFWNDDSPANREVQKKSLLTIEATRWQYYEGVKDPTLVSPDAYTLDQAYLDRPGNADIRISRSIQVGLIERVGVWADQCRILDAFVVLPARGFDRQQRLLLHFAICRTVVIPELFDRIPESANTFKIGVSILNQERAYTLRMLDGQLEPDRSAVVHQIERVSINLQADEQLVYQVRGTLEAVLVLLRTRRRALSESRKVGGNDSILVSQPRDELSIHLAGSGKSMQQHNRRCVLWAGCPVENFYTVNRRSVIADLCRLRCRLLDAVRSDRREAQRSEKKQREQGVREF